jgi:hypothetical protein
MLHWDDEYEKKESKRSCLLSVVCTQRFLFNCGLIAFHNHSEVEPHDLPTKKKANVRPRLALLKIKKLFFQSLKIMQLMLKTKELLFSHETKWQARTNSH